MNIINFKGGLGNQMFQYAMSYAHKKRGNRVGADLSWYNRYGEELPFLLTQIFPNVKIKTNRVMTEILRRFKSVNDECSNPLQVKNCYMDGYWANENYWLDLKDEIIEQFEFREIHDSNMHRLCNCINDKTTISIHIRRGDYLKPENEKFFGNICTADYYKKAILYMTQKFGDVQFLVLTNDVQWVKENMHRENFIYVSDYLKYNYPDWYEMFLMTKCNHNILANSTFSWWGAYLNKHNDKVIVTPPRWSNENISDNIWPRSWIRIQ